MSMKKFFMIKLYITPIKISIIYDNCKVKIKDYVIYSHVGRIYLETLPRVVRNAHFSAILVFQVLETKGLHPF